MKVLLTGATGLIGKEIGKKLVEEGCQLVVITRDRTRTIAELPYPATIFEWKETDGNFPIESLKDVEGVINLAGESIANARWTTKQKKTIYESRIITTKKIVDAINKMPKSEMKVHTFISASAIGIYGESYIADIKEESILGNDYLASVCKDWEAATKDLNPSIRVVHPRIGIVLSRHGGALEKMLPLFTHYLGGKLGHGNQWMSWIHITDMVRLLSFALTHSLMSGPINSVAPSPEKNKDFTKKLAVALDKWAILPAPALALKLALGEMSAIVLGGQHVSSKKAESYGFVFKYPTLESALEEICEPLKDGTNEIFTEQWVPKTPEQLFPFFSDEKNLEKLTPAFLNFKVLNKSTPSIGKDTLINYRLSLHGIPLKWQTHIEQWTPGKSFVDNQIKGPYAKWHHLHEFIPYAGGTLMRDRVHYRVPLGILGSLVSGYKVKGDVNKIFSHRRKVISNLFYN